MYVSARRKPWRCACLTDGCTATFSLSICNARLALADQLGTIRDEFPVIVFEGCEEVAVDIEFSRHFSANENGIRIGER
jgi:hypothetical protein